MGLSDLDHATTWAHGDLGTLGSRDAGTLGLRVSGT